MKKHWYFTTVYECPICGHTKEYRERQYGERPSDYLDRHRFVAQWDYCDAF